MTMQSFMVVEKTFFMCVLGGNKYFSSNQKSVFSTNVAFRILREACKSTKTDWDLTENLVDNSWVDLFCFHGRNTSRDSLPSSESQLKLDKRSEVWTC